MSQRRTGRGRWALTTRTPAAASASSRAMEDPLSSHHPCRRILRCSAMFTFLLLSGRIDKGWYVRCRAARHTGLPVPGTSAAHCGRHTRRHSGGRSDQRRRTPGPSSRRRHGRSAAHCCIEPSTLCLVRWRRRSLNSRTRLV